MFELPRGLIYAGITLIVIVMQVVIIKSRYHRYTNREFVLFFRNGKLKSEGFGGGYFVLPLIDELVVIPTTIKNLEINIKNIITKDRREKTINLFVSWQIDNVKDFYSSTFDPSSDTNQAIEKINNTLQKTSQAFISNEAIKLTEEQIVYERDRFLLLIKERIETEMNYYGVQVVTLEIYKIT